MENLLEANRHELITKSKNADTVKSYGTTRYERRKKQQTKESAKAFNKIDMNALFKSNILSFKIPIKGETADYEVEVLFEGICESIKREIKANSDTLAYKCIYRAIIKDIDSGDILVSCTCGDQKYRFAYFATKGKYNAGAPEVRVSDITNPNDTKGAGCKHVMRVLDNLNQAVNLATCIFNYINYMEEHYPDKYHKFIYPAIYGKKWEASYEEPEDELANNMTKSDADDIDAANDEGGEAPKSAVKKIKRGQI